MDTKLSLNNKISLIHIMGLAGILVVMVAPAGFPMKPAGGLVQAASASDYYWLDEFDGESLDPAWYWENENPAMWSLAVQPGFLRIYASPYPTGGENLLLRPVAQGDFMIKTRLLFEPNTNFQFAGLVIYQDEDNFLQLGRAFCDVPDACVGNGLYFDKILGGNFADSNFDRAVDSPSEAYLRLERQGQTITAFYSEDGIAWQETGSHEIPEDFAVNGVGLAASQNYSAEAIPADFDYFALGPLPPPTPRMYAQLTDDSLRFEYSAPGDTVTFSIYAAPGAELLWEGSRTADETGFAMVSIGEHRLGLQPGMFIVASDGAATKELLLEQLSLDVFNPDENIMAGTAASGREVWVVANNDPDFCGVHLNADENGDWSYDFDDQGCDVYDTMGSYAQVTDEDGDTTEVFVDFIDGWHDYDQGDVPNWACNAGGWVVDTNDRDRDLEIRILADGNEIASATAGSPTDLIGVCGEDGTCGYEVSLWGLVDPYVEHQITVQAHDQETDQWFDLNDTPRPLTCRTYDIYTFDTLTGETRQITNLRDSWEFNPRWSPDGKQIVGDVWNMDFSDHGVYITDVETGESIPLAGAERGSYPTWSPNGQWIAFDRGADQDFRLFIVPPTGGDPKLVSEDAFMASWAPSSQRLAFHQPIDGSIRTVDLKGGNETTVVERGNGPAWSPDGQWIAYEVDGDLWKVRVDINGNPQGSPIQLTSEAAWEGRPSWSPNSQSIAYHAGFDRDTDIWTIPAAGGTATWLTGGPDFADYDPNFSNSGRYVAYSGYTPIPSLPAASARLWVAAFTYDLPAGTLAEGVHPYHFEVEWSAPEPGAWVGQGGEVFVSSEAPLYDGYVLLRGPMELRRVVGRGGPVCEDVGAIHSDQPTRFLIGWVTDRAMTPAEARSHFESMTARVVWDDSASADLVRHEIRPFSMDDLDSWFQYVCTYTVRK
jgi:Tol biopolymer transport system component/regulation of enolase protein 1 (concanavalin A-like superfamily)